MLGRPYSISGTIEGGMQIGRSIGYPTANISLSEPLKQIPGFGVYAVWVDYKGVEYPAMLNIGVKPTVGYNLDRTIEAHIIGFEENIYNEEITVRFVDRLRDEMKFPSIQHLKNQLKVDRDHAIKVLDYSKK
jgi:riboflavin kinase/FMN adenylyltransferase